MELLPRFLRRPLFWAILAGLLAAWTAAGFLMVPWIVRAMATDLVRADYGRELALGEIRFNPYTLTLAVEGIALPDQAPEQAPVVSLDSLQVNLEASSLWRRALSFREIALAGLMVNAVVRPGGDLNLADLEGPRPDPAEAAPEEGLPALIIETLALSSGRIRFEDRDRPEPFVADLSPLAFTLKDFSTHAATGNLYRFEAQVFESARLAWQGTLKAEPLGSEGQLAMENLPLPRLAAYLGDDLPLVLSSGTASLRGTYRYSGGPGAGELKMANGNLDISDLKLRGRADATDVVNLPAVALAGIKADLLASRAVIGSVTLDGGRVEAWLDPDGSLSLDALLGSSSAPADADAAAVGAASAATTVSDSPAGPAPADGESPDWQVAIPLIAVNRLVVALEDRTVEPPAALGLEPLTLAVKGYATSPGTVAEVTADATVASGGRIAAAARVNLDSLATEGTIELDQVDLRAAQPYLESSTGITLLSGQAGLKGAVKYREEGGEGLVDFTGDLSVAGFRAVDDALREDFVKWDRLDLKGLDYRARPERLRIREIVARNPYARVIIGPDGATNLATALSPPGTVPAGDGVRPAAKAGEARETASPPPEPPTPFPVNIGAIRIDNGSTNFADFSTRPQFATGIEKLTGRVTGLSSRAGSRATVDLKGQVDRFSPVTIKGDVNPLSAESYLDLAMTFRNVELASFTPYSGRFAGYTIRQGKMSVDLNYLVENRQLTADHKFVIDQLELGDKVDSAEAASLPLKLAVALLKDRNGVIDLDLPVTGDLDDPKFRIGPIIWKVFVNLITKAATAPFALLGNLVGGGEDLNILDFQPGQAGLGEPERERVASLVKALTERPGLKLNVPAVYSTAADTPALKALDLERRILARKEASLKGRPPPGAEAGAGSGTRAEHLRLLRLAVESDREDYLQLLKAEFRAVAPGESLPEPPATAEGQEAEDSPEARITVLEQALRSRVEIPRTALEDLATRRAEAVQQALLADTGIDPGRAFLVAPAETRAEGGVVVMELTLR